MKTNKKIYADISEFEISRGKFYAVKFIEEYDKTFLGIGKVIKHIAKEKLVPFLFKEFDIAKDFCQFNPRWEDVHFCNDSDGSRLVLYYTYKIFNEDDEKLGYIQWEDKSVVVKDEHNYEFNHYKYPIVENFVTDINLKSWMSTFGLKDAEFENAHKFLSDVSIKYESQNKPRKHWKFELVNEEA